MAGLGDVRRGSDFKNLDCQTALSAITADKGILPRCEITPYERKVTGYPAMVRAERDDHLN
jgi:hypothetical protein